MQCYVSTETNVYFLNYIISFFGALCTSKVFQKLIMLCYTGTNYFVGGHTSPGLALLLSSMELLVISMYEVGDGEGGWNRANLWFVLPDISNFIKQGIKYWRKEGFWSICCFQLYSTSDSNNLHAASGTHHPPPPDTKSWTWDWYFYWETLVCESCSFEKHNIYVGSLIFRDQTWRVLC